LVSARVSSGGRGRGETSQATSEPRVKRWALKNPLSFGCHAQIEAQANKGSGETNKQTRRHAVACQQRVAGRAAKRARGGAAATEAVEFCDQVAASAKGTPEDAQRLRHLQSYEAHQQQVNTAERLQRDARL
jgi:hypothetical protein